MRNNKLQTLARVIKDLFKTDNRITRKPMSARLVKEVECALSEGLAEEAIRRTLSAMGNDDDQVEAYMVYAQQNLGTVKVGRDPTLTETAAKSYKAHIRAQSSELPSMFREMYETVRQ